MPEFCGIKITRAQESARHAHRRALEKAVRAISKGTKWRSSQGCIFQEYSGWFIAAHPSVHIFQPTTKVGVDVKPMSVDPIFWDVVGLPENVSTPLSFRYFGAWTCRPPQFSEADIPEHEDVDLMAADLLRVADEQVEVLTEWSLDDFLALCRAQGETGNHYLACIVTTLIALGRQDEALEACAAARLAGADGGFLAPAGTFVEMASRWLEKSMGGRCGIEQASAFHP